MPAKKTRTKHANLNAAVALLVAELPCQPSAYDKLNRANEIAMGHLIELGELLIATAVSFKLKKWPRSRIVKYIDLEVSYNAEVKNRKHGCATTLDMLWRKMNTKKKMVAQ
jgi:hypothetical protein